MGARQALIEGQGLTSPLNQWQGEESSVGQFLTQGAAAEGASLVENYLARQVTTEPLTVPSHCPLPLTLEADAILMTTIPRGLRSLNPKGGAGVRGGLVQSTSRNQTLSPHLL